MSNNSKNRLLIFACLLIIPVIIAFCGSSNIRERNENYTKATNNFAIDGADFSPIVNGVSSVFYQTATGIESFGYEVLIFIFALISLLIFRIQKLKNECDISKKELFGYCIILVSFTLLSILADMICIGFRDTDSVVLLNLAYLIPALLLVVIRAARILHNNNR